MLVFLQLFQGALPLNPEKLPNISWHLAFNTAVSFMTNTNWQSYAGETTLGILVQMLGLAVQNFVSAAVGMAVAVVFARGLVGMGTDRLGNFWADVTRGVVYILLPLSLLVSALLVSQGVIQNFSHSVDVVTLEGERQTLPMGPAASQIAIKQIGTNGGGYFNANSAHPFENPTPFSNLIQLLSILLIPVAATFMFGELVKKRRQG
ncbi:MAG: potassium-transporting ATPase subunit KdpA, partial [Proteobacteria bacterium]